MPDVVVIGAGLAGTATALFLARAGVDVLVAEARSAPPPPTPGHVELGVVEHPHRTIAALGEDRARSLFAWTARGKELLAAEGLFEACGMPWASIDAREPDEVRRSAEALGTLGIAAEVLETYGDFGPTLWLPGDGRLAEGALPTLRERAVQAGATFRHGARAHLVDGEADVVVDIAGERVTAEVAVVAAGPGSTDVAGPLRSRIVPVREQALRFSGVAGAPNIGRAGLGWTSWRQRPDGFDVTGARWAAPAMEIGRADESVIVDAIQARLEAFATRFLGARGPVTARWAWTFAQTPDGLPIVGPLPGDPRRVVCTGFGSSPASLAVAGARAVADGLLEGGGEVPWFLSPRRMVRWRA